MSVRVILWAAGVVCVVFAFVWTGFHPSPTAPAIVAVILGLSLLRTGAYDWGAKGRT
ncbi:MAG: hypothetical protein JO342_18220 [Solirubrobacterales bacterium]|nr:hypothetical protein [Solirubrobacterales bacterium]